MNKSYDIRCQRGSRTGLVEVACLNHGRNGIGKNTNFSLKESALRKFTTGLIATKLHQTGPRTVNVTGIDIFHVARGKIVEPWTNVDDLGAMQQLGVISCIKAG